MSFDYEELCSNIRARPIGWDGYQRTGTVTKSEVDQIKAIDKVSQERRLAIVEKNLDGYAALFLGSGSEEKGILGRIGRNNSSGDIIQYILVLMGDLLDKIPGFDQALLKTPQPFANLLPLLSHTDVNVPIFTSKVLTTLLAKSLASNQKHIPNDTKTALPTYLLYLATLTKSQDSYSQDLGVQSYGNLLRTSYARNTFWNMGDDALRPLIKILEASAGGTGNERGASAGIIQGGVSLQLLYHVLLVIWQLSFETAVAEEIHSKYDIIPTLTYILRSALKEKIARITTATLYNLAVKSPADNLRALLVAKALPLFRATAQRFTSDEDLASDLAYLIDTLESYQKSQTTFDEYAAEVRSGHLSWSPPHTNTDFWKKNARRIVDEANGELVSCLARALGSSHDKVVLAVAAHDVGVLVREVPEKRRVWEQLGVKGRIMELMGDSDAQVRYQALTAVRGFLEHAFSS